MVSKQYIRWEKPPQTRQPYREWISVNDAIPIPLKGEEDEIHVICFNGDIVFYAFYDNIGFLLINTWAYRTEHSDFFEETMCRIDDVTHWMPLPQPPVDRDLNLKDKCNG